jgi:hypothetical protein
MCGVSDELYTDTCNPEVLVGKLMSLDVSLSFKEGNNQIGR